MKNQTYRYRYQYNMNHLNTKLENQRGAPKHPEIGSALCRRNVAVAATLRMVALR